MVRVSRGIVCGIALSGLAVALVGCSAEDGLEGSEESLLEAERAPLELKTAKGQVFVRKGRLKTAKPVVDEHGAIVPPPARTSRDYSKLSDAELGRVLSPKMARAGYEYVAKEAPADLVRAVRTNRAVGELGNPGFRPSAEEDVNPEDLAGKTVFSPDSRVLHRDNTAYPFNTIVWLDNGCTGTLIGASTVVTAAHCVHNGSSWTLPSYLYPGYDAQDSDPDPYGRFGCYDVTIPGGWDSDKDAADDYAVIEFSGCGAYPGNATGWLGVYATNSGGNISGKMSYLYGYPGDKSPYPQIWGIGNDSLDTSIWYPARVFHSIDTYNGQSGSGIYQKRTGSPCDGRCVVGIHKGGFDSNENHGRWLDTDVWSFIQAYSAL